VRCLVIVELLDKFYIYISFSLIADIKNAVAMQEVLVYLTDIRKM